MKDETKEGFVKIKMPTYYIAKHSDDDIQYSEADLQAAVAAEQEACAKVADNIAKEMYRQGEGPTGYILFVEECAAAIRARGDTSTKLQNIDTSEKRVHEIDIRKAAEMALEALERGTTGLAIRAIPALRQALAQPEQEPMAVLKVWDEKEKKHVLINYHLTPPNKPEQEPELVGVIGNWGRVEWADGVYPQMGDRLYSAPPSKPWVSLTDDEIMVIRSDAISNMGIDFQNTLCRAIEAKLKEKNHV